jgi:thioesterase domain-containing protein
MPPPSGWSPIVAIQPNGSRPPFFCIHGAGGNVLIYRDLSLHLGPDQPFYGLQSQGLDGSCTPLTRIEDMAALYAKEIRRLQPHGPYLLGGYCLGGTIAFEVARQLHAKGEEIALLALFDTLNWSKTELPSFWVKSYHTIERLVFHAGNILRLDSAGKVKFLSEKVKILRNRLPVWGGMLLSRFRKSSPATNSNSRILSHIWQANDRAAMDYVPQRYAGSLTDFRPMKQYRMFNKPGVKWDQLAEGGERVIVLPVYPAGMLVEPFVKHLADALNRSIEEAMVNHATQPPSPKSFAHAF